MLHSLGTYTSVLCFLGLLCHFTSYIDPTPVVSGSVTLAGVQDMYVVMLISGSCLSSEYSTVS